MDNETINIALDDFKIKIPPLYIYTDHRSKFVYKGYKKGEIVGLTNSLVNRVIELKKEEKVNEKEIGQISLDGEVIGWIHLENLIRLYRLPNIKGKFKNFTESKFNDTDFTDELIRLRNRIIKARYYFTYDNKNYLMVSAVGENKSYPLLCEDFKKNIVPREDAYVYVKAETPLFFSSNYNSMVGKVEKEKDYKLISFFEDTNQARIRIGSKSYWVKSNDIFTTESEETSILNDLEIIDMITYMKDKNKLYKEKIVQQNKNIKTIKDNLKIDNDFQTLFLQKYLGDINEY